MSKNMAVLNDNNEVVNIIICNDDELETSNLITYTDSNPACIGGTFDSGYFYPPQPFKSWVKNAGIWNAPIPIPEDVSMQKQYFWDEASLSWVESTIL
jgi:hypothetical protein